MLLMASRLRWSASGEGIGPNPLPVVYKWSHVKWWAQWKVVQRWCLTLQENQDFLWWRKTPRMHLHAKGLEQQFAAAVQWRHMQGHAPRKKKPGTPVPYGEHSAVIHTGRKGFRNICQCQLKLEANSPSASVSVMVGVLRKIYMHLGTNVSPTMNPLSLIRHRLEHCIQASSPYIRGDINKLKYKGEPQTWSQSCHRRPTWSGCFVLV